MAPSIINVVVHEPSDGVLWIAQAFSALDDSLKAQGKQLTVHSKNTGTVGDSGNSVEIAGAGSVGPWFGDMLVVGSENEPRLYELVEAISNFGDVIIIGGEGISVEVDGNDAIVLRVKDPIKSYTMNPEIVSDDNWSF